MQIATTGHFLAPFSNRIWSTAVAGEADRELTLSSSVCHIGGPNSVNPGQIVLVYGTYCVGRWFGVGKFL